VGTFLAEGYLASATADGLARDGARAAAASELAADAGQVRYLGAVFLPADQTCLMIFEAACAEHVARACQRAGLPCDRVTTAVITPAVPAGAAHSPDRCSGTRCHPD
jgi:hypothetical protein